MALIYAPLVVWLRKASSLVLVAILAGTMVPIDIALEAHVRMKGGTAPWMYADDGPLGSVQPLLRIIIVWAVDGVIMGPVALWLARQLAQPLGRLFSALTDDPTPPTTQQWDALFAKEWSSEPLHTVKHDLSFYVLRGVGLAYVAYACLLLVGFVGVEVWPGQARDLLDMSYLNPALTINTFIKISFVANLAFIGAYNRELRFHTGLILFLAHAISTASLSFFLVIAPPADRFRPFLAVSIAADGAMATFLLWVMWRYQTNSTRYRQEPEFPEFFSVPRRLAKIFWHVFAWFCAIIPVGVLGMRFVLNPSHGWGAVYGYPDPLICNTVTKYSTMSIIGFVIMNREELREKLVVVIVDGFVISVVSSVIWLLFGDLFCNAGVHTRVGTMANVDWYFAFNVALDGSVVALILALRRMYYDVDYGIASMSVASARNVMALHETLYPQSAEQGRVARSIDRHVAGIRGRKRGLLNFPFALIEKVLIAVYGLRPRFSLMEPAERLFWLRRYVLRPPNERRRSFIPLFTEAVYRLGGAAHAFVNFGHYSQSSARHAIQYVPPGARKRLQGLHPTASPPSDVAPLPTNAADPANFAPPSPAAPPPVVAPRVVSRLTGPALPLEVDYLIVGSGAGGAVVAYRLAEKVASPQDILVVERGPRFSPLVDFSDDEMEMVRKLYKEGGLQQTKRFGLTILQGECVGGSTVINNACCAPIPDRILETWKGEYGLELGGLKAAYEEVGRELHIEPLDPKAVNPEVSKAFDTSVEAYNREHGNRLQAVEIRSNHLAPLGTGLDNLGDRHMRKRSMLETYLPWAEARGVQLAAETTAVRFVANGGTAKEVILQTAMGALRRVRVKKAVIVSGGVIASSHFLLRSGVKGMVGRNVSCNFAIPSTIDFNRSLAAYDGLQITRGAIDAESRAIFETYFNPPASFAISLPFYFDRHRTIMSSYTNLVNFGALVGSQPGGVVERQANVIDGRSISWKLSPLDVENIKFALQTLVEIACSGSAKRIILRTEPGLDIEPTKANVERFAESLKTYPLGMADLALATSHPQGGNRMAHRESKQGSTLVVDSDYRLVGFDNVYVVDASVFPTGITVNPQWTIMALASMAAEPVLRKHE